MTVSTQVNWFQSTRNPSGVGVFQMPFFNTLSLCTTPSLTTVFRLGKHDFQKLIQSYPDLLQKVEALVMERIESVLMLEEREKHRKPFSYVSINQHAGDRRSTDL